MEPPPKKDRTKRYECAEVIWPFANVLANEGGRRCAVQDEQDWWTSWKDAVRNAVLARKTGYVTLEDRMDVAMGVVALESGKDWGVSK
jgi:thymidine phosphorylase